MTRKTYIIVITVLVFVSMLTGCSGGSSSSRNESSNTTYPIPAPSTPRSTITVIGDCVYADHDPNVHPIVHEYVWGHLGVLPNIPSIECAIRAHGWELYSGQIETDSGDVLPVYVKPSDPQGQYQLAIVTVDGFMVILEGQRQLELLFAHGFAKDPVVDNLPLTLILPAKNTGTDL